MKKNTIILITIALILLALIGAGVWTLVNRPNNQQPKGAQDTTANQQNKTQPLINRIKRSAWMK